MKRYIDTLVIAAFLTLCFSALCASEQKGRLYFEGTKVIVSADMNPQPEFLSKIDKTIDAELFSARVMPFVGAKEREEIKSKISKCDKIECVLTESGKLGVAIFVRSEISFLPDSFKGTLKMYETAQGNLIAEVSKIGNLENPEKQYSEIVSEFILESQFYFTFKKYSKGVDDFESFTVTPFDPVVDFAGFVIPDAEVVSKQEQTKVFPPEQMIEFHDLNNIKDSKLIAFYEDALRADRLGESDSVKAVEAWKKVIETADEDIKNFAIKRSNEWFFYAKEVRENELLNKNLDSEQELQLFPEMIIKLWQDFIKLNPTEERAKLANDKIALYSQKHVPIKKYVDERSKLLENGQLIHKRSIESIAEPKIKIGRKIDMFLNFMKKYGAIDDDFHMLDSFIDQLSNDEEKSLAKKNVYNKWNAQFFKSKCINNDFQACIISEQIYRKIKEDNEAVAIQVSGCKKGILELCASLAQTKLAALNDPELKTLAEKSCAMGSAKGCVVLANFYGVAVAVKPKAKKELLYKVGCARGYAPACKGAVKLEQSEAVVKPQAVAASAPVVSPEVKKEQPVKEKKEKKPSEFLKTHPYFWYGFSSALAGAVLGVVSIYYGAQTNNNYADYNDKATRLIKNIKEFKALSYEEQIATIKRNNNLLSDGDKYKKIAIGTGIAGGALIVTGVILMVIKKPMPDNEPQVTFFPSKDGFMVGASFAY